MEGRARRKKIIDLLQDSQEAVPGAVLAKQLGVSRQVIVQDIALLRAVNKNILSTSRGYLLFQQRQTAKAARCFRVCHSREQIKEELDTIVDLGGKVCDVIVAHPVYGEINVDLIISTRQDVKEFVDKIKSQEGGVPLMEIANGVHIHTVEADCEAVLDRIEAALDKLGILCKE